MNNFCSFLSTIYHWILWDSWCFKIFPWGSTLNSTA